MILPLMLIRAKYVPLFRYCSKCGTRGNERHLPSFERWQAVFFRLPIVGVCSVAVLIEILLRGIQLTETMTNMAQAVILVKCLITGRLVGYSSGQRGQTVNLLAYAYEGSNPSPTTIFMPINRINVFGIIVVLTF